MATTRQLNIKLPVELADALHERVVSGGYADESEAIADSLRDTLSHDEALERWLRADVLDAIHEAEADPSSLLTSDEIRAQLAAHHAKRLASGSGE